jgi:6-phosphogluconolactonase
MLTALNTVSSGGGGACHLVVDKTGGNLLVANYGSGSVACFRLAQDGRIGERTALIQHAGAGPNAGRQRGPHAHSVVLSPDNRFLFVPDLGLDKIFIYRFDAGQGTLSANDPPFGAVPPGSGSRHFAFHPNGRFAYAVNEMKSSVTAFAFDRETGALRDPRTVSNLPDGFSGVDNSAEIEVDAGGKFLYASNRGHDSITIYSIDPASGALTTVDRVPAQGKTPRNFKIDPTGRYLFAANQDSDSIVVFSRNADTGRLKALTEVHLSAPVCIQFLPAP